MDKVNKYMPLVGAAMAAVVLTLAGVNAYFGGSKPVAEGDDYWQISESQGAAPFAAIHKKTFHVVFKNGGTVDKLSKSLVEAVSQTNGSWAQRYNDLATLCVGRGKATEEQAKNPPKSVEAPKVPEAPKAQEPVKK